MKIVKPALLAISALLICACSGPDKTEHGQSGEAESTRENSLPGVFQANDAWRTVSDVIVKDGSLEVQGDGKGDVLIKSDSAQEAPLLTKGHFGDSTVKMEFFLPESASAGLYIQGRYRINLDADPKKKNLRPSDLGGLAHRFDSDRETPHFDGRAPNQNAALPPGQWQTIEVEFRAPRYDDAGKKVGNALLLSVTVNGKTVQRNTVATGFTENPLNNWETTSGPMMIRADNGPIAIRNFDVRRADFSQISVPDSSGEATNRDELIDFVAKGKELFHGLGCVSCHVIKKDDPSVRLGPSLYGLFTREPSDHEIAVVEDGDRFVIKADRSYLHRSLRDAPAEVPVRQSGERQGEAYAPDMPPYGEDMVSDTEIDAIGAYLKTLNPLPDQGPVIDLVEPGGPEQYDPLLDGMQFLVTDRVRIQRGSMPGLSGRSIHVGQPNGINYSFDPRMLAIGRIWQGGFLDMSGELSGRGGQGLRVGFEAREIDLGGEEALFAPLNAEGKLIDFSFKEAKFQDYERIEESLYSDTDHLERLAKVDAQFLGYERDSTAPKAPPTFRYRVGDNELAVQTHMGGKGQLKVEIQGAFETEQNFKLNTAVIRDIQVSEGDISEGVWTIPEASSGPVTLKGEISVGADPWRPVPKDFDHRSQPLKVVDAKADLPKGYQIENYLPPKDNYGREQLFEALGLAQAPDGTLVVATRTAGIWRLVDGRWELFADGLFDVLGVKIEDDQGLTLVVTQKAELTRISDTNGDGRADRFETLFDAHSFHGNYHTYLHGPARDEEGNYYIGINLAHTDEAVYKADGLYMGSHGGLLGWAVKVTPEGDYELWANGLRSPAGMGRAPDGRLWMADNQGEFVSTSKLYLFEEDAFYGHPSGLVDLPGMTPDSPEIAWENVAERREKEVVLLPQNILANSPGHPVWDTTGGAFGPFEGQIFIGDQTRSNLLRIGTEVVNGQEQGFIVPFARELASGAMRPLFLDDGSLMVGQTGRGWQSRGGHVAALQRIVWDGQTVQPTIHSVSATAKGFKLTFTHPLDKSVDAEALRSRLALESWTYRDAPDYGSERLGLREEEVIGAKVSDDRMSLSVNLASTEIPQVHPQQVGRLYRIRLKAGEGLFGVGAPDRLEAYYSLYQFDQ